MAEAGDEVEGGLFEDFFWPILLGDEVVVEEFDGEVFC